MIEFTLNGKTIQYHGDENITLLDFLRLEKGIISVKDGCSGQAACGACMVEKDGKPALSCVLKMKRLTGADIVTLEGFPPVLLDTIAKAFVKKGAVQCGFCTPGFITRTKLLLEQTPIPSREEINQALKNNLCRCTGYIKIIEAVQLAADSLRDKKTIELDNPKGIGKGLPKYDAYNKAVGKSPFVNDLFFDGMAYGALKFSDHPRAKIVDLDTAQAEKLPGVIRVFRADDIPGERFNGLIYNDWPVMIQVGETTRYIGDVLAGVVAKSEAIAREAVKLIKVEYEVLEPLTDMRLAENSEIKVHQTGPMKDKGNLLDTCIVRRGEDADQLINSSVFVVHRIYETQRIEHAFLETETTIARPWKDNGLELFSPSQGVYEDQRQIARILGMPPERINVNLVPNGGGFGGKEDLSVQGHAALFAYHLKRPVKVHLSRDESIRMHPKRHPIILDYTLGCDDKGKFTIAKVRILGDTGAYASVGTKVLERAAGHATGGYHFPNVDLVAKTLYTNNLPCGAMRGFGANQATWALESAIDELCELGGFDRWQIRYDNALVNGSMTSTGQILHKGVGVRECLEAIKEEFYQSKYAGIGCAIKNCGVGNGMPDFSEVKIEIRDKVHVVIHHGWTEMGQGVNTVAAQFLSEETGIDPAIVEVVVSTQYSARSGMTTSSRGTSLVGNAIIEASKKLKADLKTQKLVKLVGKIYRGYWVCDWTTKPGDPGEVITHYSYSYAAQLAILDDTGKLIKMVAAHDAGKIINPVLFEGQIQGSVHMGIGYALTEELPQENGYLKSGRLRDLGILPITETPEIKVIGVEVADPFGPHGAKGVGEIGLVPTAGAVANALYRFDGVRRLKLPLIKKK